MRLNLKLNENEELLKKTALEFMRRDAPKLVVEELQDTDTGFTEELWRKAVNLGWTGILIPEEYGGAGNSFTSAGALYEALGTGPLPGPYFSSGVLGSQIVLAAGTEEQKKQILPQVASGRQILALALTEPQYSWEPGSVQTVATSKGGDIVLDGVKLFVSDAQAATHLIVAARSGDASDPAKRISLFIVDRQAPGVSVRRLPGFLNGRSFEVKLNGVKVPQSATLGASSQGWSALEQAITKSIPVLCAYKVGACQTVIEQALEYSRVRVQFGQAVGRFQRVQDLIIEMVNHSDAARWTTYEALWKLDTGKPAAESVHLAKTVASQSYWDVVTLAHQVFSGISYSREHPISFHTRASRDLYNFLGDPAYHRQKLGQILVAS